MDSATYSFPPGGVSRRGTSAASSIPWARAAQAPAFDGSVAAEWNPASDVETSDPHDQPPFTDIGADIVPVDGELAPNVTGGGDFPVDAVFADNSAQDFSEVPDNIHTE
jgi:hypothetical protein